MVRVRFTETMTQPESLDTVGRFSDRAADYVRYRPSYPPAAIELILEGLGSPADLTVADIGAGTGISARLVADRGVRVIAVEPGDGMRSAAAPHDNVTWVAGLAEATGLERRPSTRCSARSPSTGSHRRLSSPNWRAS